jgi:hypothetical protein
VVFEGNVPADIRQNAALASAAHNAASGTGADSPRIWLGDPVAIKEPTRVMLRRQSGANLLIVGQQEEPALSLMSAALLSLAAQQPPDRARFVILDGTPADSSLAGMWDRLRSIFPHDIRSIDYRHVGEAVAELAAERQRRQDAEESRPPAVYFFVHGLHRYRVLRKGEDSFSFGSSSESAPQPDRQFTDLLREGPPLGIHVIAWIDTVVSLERTFDRGSTREFDHRVLFQMSANDSSTLIDSPLANKLGANRALAYSEEQGIVEKFRPYSIPPLEWVASIMPKKG